MIKIMKNLGVVILLFVITLMCLVNVSKNEIVVSATEDNTPKIEMYKNNVSYSSEMYILYAFTYENIDLQEYDVEMLFWESVQEEYVVGTEAYKVSEYIVDEIGGVKCLIFYSKGLATKNMTDDIYSRIYVDMEEDYYSEVNKFSILEYAHKMLESGTLSELKVKFFKAMLEYGSYAQQIFGYNTDKLANSVFYNINIINGSLKDGFKQGRYQEGQVIELTTSNSKWYKFLNWTDGEGNIVSDKQTFEYKVTKSTTLTANYTTLQHTEEILPAKEPTCSEEGLTVGLKCSECGEILIEQHVIEKLPHTEEIVEAVTPTCKSEGLTEGIKCSVCDEFIVKQEIIPMLECDKHDVTFDLNGGKWDENYTEIEHFCGIIDLPIPVRENYKFIGWYDKNASQKNYYLEDYIVNSDIELTAEWAYVIQLEASGGKIVGIYKTVDEIKDEFLRDINKFLGSNYKLNNISIWENRVYKMFLDDVYGNKWKGLLEYFYDIEKDYYYNVAINYENGLYPGTNSQFFDLVYWEALLEGKDLEEEFGTNTAPFAVTFTIKSWFQNTHYIGTYYHGADYSGEEINDKALSYFTTNNTLYVIEGESVNLPYLQKGNVNFFGWMDPNGNIVSLRNYYPSESLTLTAKFGVEVTIDVNDNVDDPVLNDITTTIISVKEGDAPYVLPILQRPHYDFLGWYNEYDEEVTCITNEDYFSRLYAKWQGNIHVLDFVLNEGSSNFVESTRRIVVYGNQLGELPELKADGLVFLGWYDKDGKATGNWGNEITSSFICEGDIILYANFRKPYSVILDWNGEDAPSESSYPVKVDFLTDFYNWCIKQNVFNETQVSLNEFIGINEEGEYNFSGLWFNYTGAPGNPSSLYPNFDSDVMVNCFLNHTGENATNGVMEDSFYFLNDSEMNSKWAPFMEYIETLFKTPRVWTSLTAYGLYDLGRYFMEFNNINSYISLEQMKTIPEAYKGKYFEQSYQQVEFLAYDLTGELKFPILSKEGYVFLGWTIDGKEVYDCIMSEDICDKVLVPCFNQIIVVEATPDTYLTIIENAKPGTIIELSAGNYYNDIELSIPYITLKGTHDVLFNGTIIISSNNIIIDGIKFTGGDSKSTVATIGLKNCKDISIINCYFDRVYGTISTSTYKNNRRPHIAQYINCTAENIIISNNTFDWSNHTSTFLKVALAFNSVKNLEITYNKNIGNGAGYYLFDSEGIIKISGNEFTGTVKGNGTIVE